MRHKTIPQSRLDSDQRELGARAVVSVVIPSVGRACLKDAVESALAQRDTTEIELIVVFDLAESAVPDCAALAASKADRVLYTGGGKRACHARNLGVAASTSPWIAFLDDDDVWVPTKLVQQLECAFKLQAEGKRPVVGSRATLHVGGEHPSIIDGVPSKLVADGDLIEDYLFSRRRPGSRRASFFTSSILAERQLCLDVVWDESLSRHQDWDWLVRAGRLEATAFIQVPNDLLVYKVGSEGSISARADWIPSLSWARQVLRASPSKRSFVDFLSAQTLRYALQMRDMRGAFHIIKAVLEARTIPSIGPVLIGLAGLIPRRQIEKLMVVIK